MKQNSILWVDDEVELLRPHILFLEEKGYTVTKALSGVDALDAIGERDFDIIFLDENMPGLTGLETLQRLKAAKPFIPVVMVTKNDDESVMNQAIGGKIADYLIKPVNPNQLLPILKKNLHRSGIITETATMNYRQAFSLLGEKISARPDIKGWMELYRELVYWDIELQRSAPDMAQLLAMQKQEADSQFSKFIIANYKDWIKFPENRPLMSPDIFKNKVFPLLDQGEKVFFVLIDNFRLDQWEVVKGMLSEFYTFEEDLYTAILPTVTQYARNAIFSGLMPLEIERMFPDLWVDEESEEGKNLNEAPMIKTLLERFRKHYTFSYNKVYETGFGDKLLRQINSLKQFDLNVIVLNFVDMLSHARTESKMIRELAANEAAYRSLTQSWFRHSSTHELFRRMASLGYKVVLTTDHGTKRVKGPVKVIGDKNTNTNLRYKVGKNLSYDRREVFEISKPEEVGLPRPNVSSRYVFCCEDHFFAYPNNYNYYVQYYQDTFQHGGVSMEEMLVPIITMQPK